MRDVAPAVGTTLDAIAPRLDERGDWGAVLRDATPRRSRRRFAYLAIAVALLAAALGAALLAWPSSDGGASFTDRALAAVGDGPVLHVVLESPRSLSLVNLRTGESREAHSRTEIWFDPSRGYHTIDWFEGRAQSNWLTKEVSPEANKLFAEFASGYRNALKSGKVKEVRDDEIDGVPVTWIRVFTRELRTPEGKLVQESEDVAVSQETLKPVYLGGTLYGKPLPARYYVRVAEVESLAAGKGNFRGKDPSANHSTEFGGPSSQTSVTPAEARRVLGRPAYWLGPRIAGLPLVAHWRYDVTSRHKADDGRRWHTRKVGLQFSYGTPKGDPGVPGGAWANQRKRHVNLVEVRRLKDAVSVLDSPFPNYVPPEGTVLVAGRSAVVRMNDVIVLIAAENKEVVLQVARALRPWAG